MPLQRFRTFEAARRALWTTSDDPRLPGRIRNLWHTGSRLSPLLRPPGMMKFRSIEDANAERAGWVRKVWPALDPG